MEILVSVIIPVYKVEAYLERCVKSVIKQTLQKIEIILVDDGSPDHCPEMCDTYAKQDNRIQVIHQKNAGLGMARNTGLNVAKGKYIAFVDSDDFLPLDALEKLYNTAIKNSADTILAGYYRKNEQKIMNCPLPFRNVCFEGKKDILENILTNMLGSPTEYHDDIMLKRAVWASLYSRDLIEKHHIRFCSEREFISEDLIFDLEYYPVANKVVLAEEFAYYYCVNGTSLTLSYNKDRFQKQLLLYHEIKRRTESLGLTIDERLCRSFIGNARQCIYSEAKHLGILDARRGISRICQNVELKKALKEFNSTGMPVKQKIFLLLMKYELSTVIFCVCKMFK